MDRIQRVAPVIVGQEKPAGLEISPARFGDPACKECEQKIERSFPQRQGVGIIPGNEAEISRLLVMLVAVHEFQQRLLVRKELRRRFAAVHVDHMRKVQ